MITRALGPEPEVQVDTMTFSARAGDVFLLCSDGLTTMLTDEDVATIVAGDDNLQMVARRLIRAANDRGGRDNITVVLFRLESADDAVGEGETLVGPSADDAGLNAEAVRAGVAATGGAAAGAASGERAAPPRRRRAAPAAPPVAATPARTASALKPASSALGPISVSPFAVGASSAVSSRKRTTVMLSRPPRSLAARISRRPTICRLSSPAMIVATSSSVSIVVSPSEQSRKTSPARALKVIVSTCDARARARARA